MPENVDRIEGTVLVVDDEVIVKDACRMMLNALGCKVFAAGNGKEAIEIYQKNQNEIDVVLLDMAMADMDGAETFEHIKVIHPEVKVVVISGNTLDRETAAMLNRGCRGFIHKPFTLKTLWASISAVLQTK